MIISSVVVQKQLTISNNHGGQTKCDTSSLCISVVLYNIVTYEICQSQTV